MAAVSQRSTGRAAGARGPQRPPPASATSEATQSQDTVSIGTPGATQAQRFACKIDSTLPLVKVLSSIELDRGGLCSCSVTDRGIKFTMHRLQTMQAKAYVKRAIFDEYEVPELSCNLAFKLSNFLACLQVFGDSARLQMSWDGGGSPLVLVLERDGVVTRCELRTSVPSEVPDINFRGSELTARLVMASSYLRDAFAELDTSDARTVQIGMSPAAPFLTMQAVGDSGSCRVEFTEDKSDVFSEIGVEHGAVQHSYNLDVVRPCLKVLGKAQQTNVRTNARGVLSMQHVIPTNESTSQWIEFLVCALEDD